MGEKPNILEAHKRAKEISEIAKEAYGINHNFPSLESIAQDISKEKDYAMSIEFTKSILGMLEKNGVEPKIYQYTGETQITPTSISEKYGIFLEGLDFSEHDREFEEEIEKLKSELEESKKHIEVLNGTISEMQSRFGKKAEEIKIYPPDNSERYIELPCEPIEVAQMLITQTIPIPALQIGDKKVDGAEVSVFGISGLRQIAEHLLVYCNNNKDEG